MVLWLRNFLRNHNIPGSIAQVQKFSSCAYTRTVYFHDHRYNLEESLLHWTKYFVEIHLSLRFQPSILPGSTK